MRKYDSEGLSNRDLGQDENRTHTREHLAPALNHCPTPMPATSTLIRTVIISLLFFMLFLPR